jgi:hypothetical protein
MNKPSLSDQKKNPELDELITFTQAAKLSGFTDRHLRHLAKTGDMWAKKLGRNWFTTARAIQDYLSQTRKTGPKPKI